MGYAPVDADDVFLISDDGRRFDAPILYTLTVAPDVQLFAFAVPPTKGQLHFQDGNGTELRTPIPLNSAP